MWRAGHVKLPEPKTLPPQASPLLQCKVRSFLAPGAASGGTGACYRYFGDDAQKGVTKTVRVDPAPPQRCQTMCRQRRVNTIANSVKPFGTAIPGSTGQGAGSASAFNSLRVNCSPCPRAAMADRHRDQHAVRGSAYGWSGRTLSWKPRER